MQLFINIFEKQDGAFRVDLPVGFEQGGQGDQVAPFQNASGRAVPVDPAAGSLEEVLLRVAADGVGQGLQRKRRWRVQVDQHGGVQGHHAGALEDRIEQGAQVTETGDDFGMLPDQLEVDERQHFHRAVAAAQGQDHVDCGIGEGGVELGCLRLRRGQPLRELRIDDGVAEAGELLDGRVENALLFDQIAGRDNEDVVQRTISTLAGLESAPIYLQSATNTTALELCRQNIPLAKRPAHS